MRRENLQYNKCKTNYKPFPSTLLDEISIDYAKQPVLIKLFDLGISTRKVAVDSDVNYSVAQHAFGVMWFSIL